MRSKPLIIPGYIVGLGSLFIITYRTLLAFFSNSKSITVNINRYGEQYLDLFFLIIIWIICLLGLLYLIRYLKDERTRKMPKQITNMIPAVTSNEIQIPKLYESFNDDKTEFQLDILIDTSKDMDQKSYLSNDGKNLLVSYDSINSYEDN